jgi:hypothetical protein
VRTSMRVTLVAAAVVVVVIAMPVAAVEPHDPAAHPSVDTDRTSPRVPATKVRGASGPPQASGYFVTLPPGAPLPTDAQCAARIHRSSWEPRPQNNTANHTVVHQPVQLPDNPALNATWQQHYKPRITGNFAGTTDEIIQWASCKWGIADNLTRARAVQESTWYQSKVGDFEARTRGHCAPGWSTAPVCPTSFGLLQSKWYFRPGVYPGTKVSTAFNVDSVLAETRGCIDGLDWFGPVSKGDVWGCVGLWFSGAWNQNDAAYIASVQSSLAAEPWLTWKG